MKFVTGQGVWHLIDDSSSSSPLVIATLKSEVEVLALGKFCELFLAAPENLPSQFEVRYEGKSYTAYFLGEKGEKLTLHLTSEGQSVTTISTELVL